MSKLFLVVVIVLAAFAVHGYFRGFVRVVFSLVSIVLTIALVSWVSPFAAELLQERTPVYEMVKQRCIDKVKESAQKELQQQEQGDKISIAGIELPDELQGLIRQGAGEAADSFMEETGVYEEMGAYIAGFVVKGIACILSFIIIGLILRILINLLDVVTRLPVVKGMNHIGGLAAGILEGLIIVWILFFVITLCQTSSFGQNMMVQINQNPILLFLYRNNGIEYMMMKILLHV